MACLLLHCIVIVCVAGLALCVLDTEKMYPLNQTIIFDFEIPCNNENDCYARQCCATISSAKAGYKGVCRQYTSHCYVNEVKEGECGCRSTERCQSLIIAGTPILNGVCLPRA